jgi:hypothetical protein
MTDRKEIQSQFACRMSRRDLRGFGWWLKLRSSKRMEAKKKNDYNMEWRPQLFANSIISLTFNECLFLHMRHTMSALMSQIEQNRSSNLTLLVSIQWTNNSLCHCRVTQRTGVLNTEVRFCQPCSRRRGRQVPRRDDTARRSLNLSGWNDVSWNMGVWSAPYAAVVAIQLTAVVESSCITPDTQLTMSFTLETKRPEPATICNLFLPHSSCCCIIWMV